jgi:hypothetical protein
MRDSDADDDVTIGGPMPWFSVRLSIAADDLDPDEVTRLLGVAPTTTRRRGVRWPVPVRSDRPDGLSLIPARIGLWSIQLRPEQAPGCDVAAAVAAVLDRVAAVPPESWRRACAGAQARVSVALTLDAYNRGFGFGPALLRRIADLGLELDFDIYEGPDDDLRRRTRKLVREIERNW